MSHAGISQDSAGASAAPRLSQVERRLLCETLERVGPDAPTLCDGWNAHQLVAHLHAREANPILAAMTPSPPLSDWAAARTAISTDFRTLVARVRNGPPRILTGRLRRLEPHINTLEFYIHHEDVRRATPSWDPRVLPLWAEDQIWIRVAGLASVASRGKKAAVVFERSDTGQRSRAGKLADITVRGLPSEISLHASGRARISRVEVLGSASAVAAYLRSGSTA